MTRRQREIGLRGRVVMVGRDIGTVVLPEADLKLYVVASLEERARRRHQELLDRGEATDREAIQAAMAERDRYDSTRTLAPLRPAEDARILDTTQLTAEQAAQHVLKEYLD
jgi:cytidylate kinase